LLAELTALHPAMPGAFPGSVAAGSPWQQARSETEIRAAAPDLPPAECEPATPCSDEEAGVKAEQPAAEQPGPGGAKQPRFAKGPPQRRTDGKRECEDTMTWTRGSIDHGETVNHTEVGDIHITGKIDGGSNATLVSTNGSIIIDGKVGGHSTVALTAKHVIRIGAAGNDDGEKKIDGGSTVSARADGDISVGHKIDNNSVVTLVSNLGSITIGGKIDQNSHVTLTAAGNIRIGESGNDGAERKIDGNSHVDARAGGTIHLFNKIDGGSISGDHTVVDFRACRGIQIDDKIDGGSIVRLAVRPGRINDEHPPLIEIGDKIGGGGTQVFYFPDGSLHVENGVDSHGSATPVDWAGPLELCNAGPSGYYWRNWPQTFGYVTDGRNYP
jgi:hypothetical protein